MLSGEKPAPLSLEITSSAEAPPSAASSSSHSSPTSAATAGILDNDPSGRNSISSSLRSQNVTFAPLPEIGRRKRKSSAPLGMEARRQLGDRRRQRMQLIQNGSPMWTNEEIEQQAQRAKSEHQELTEEDDPFLVLGKLVKDAGKQLWKKVSNKDPKSKGESTNPLETNEHIPPLPTSATEEFASTADTIQENDEWKILDDTTTNGETELSNEKEDDYDSKFGTQTIVEGYTKYSWVKGKADELAARLESRNIEIPLLPFEVPTPSYYSNLCCS